MVLTPVPKPPTDCGNDQTCDENIRPVSRYTCVNTSEKHVINRCLGFIFLYVWKKVQS